MLKLVIAIVLMSSLVYASETTTNEAQTLDSLASALKVLMDEHRYLKDQLVGTTTRSPKPLHPIKNVADAIGKVARFAFKNLANTAVAAIIFNTVSEKIRGQKI